MTASPARLERRYRRALRAYPGSFRLEILTTLLEMAEAGHGRSSAAESLHLVVCGLRQRFRLPARQPLAVVAALLAAIAVGALGAAGGTWLGWQTATPMPSSDVARDLTADLAGGSRSDVAVYPWETAMNGPAVTTRVTIPSAYSAERVRTALTSAGWRITSFAESTGGIVVDLTEDPYVTVPTRSVRFRATKDGLTLSGDSMTVAADDRYGVDGQTDQAMDAWADETGAVRPLTITGLLLGAMAGWLVTAALAHRVRRNGRSRRRVMAAWGTTAFAAAVVPTFVLYRDLYQVLVYDSGAPNPYIVSGPSDQLTVGVVAACTGIGILAFAADFLIVLWGARSGPDQSGQEPVTTG